MNFGCNSSVWGICLFLKKKKTKKEDCLSTGQRGTKPQWVYIIYVYFKLLNVPASMHGDLTGPSLERPSQTLLIRPLHSHRPRLHTKVEIYPRTSGLGMARLHIQYSSIIVWIHCQDSESVTPTLLPLKSLIWEWEAHAAAVKTSAKRLKCKCRKMCSKTVGQGHLGSCSWILPGKVDG